MAIIIDMSNCACCVCCPRAYLGLPSLHVLTVFDWSDGHYEPTFNVTYDTGEQKWIGSADCNGQTFTLKFWCIHATNSWQFDLISNGINYAEPSQPGTPGGCTLQSCNPFFLYGEITSGWYGDDFPFCDKSGTFPGGQFLSAFQFFATE